MHANNFSRLQHEAHSNRNNNNSNDNHANEGEIYYQCLRS